MINLECKNLGYAAPFGCSQIFTIRSRFDILIYMFKYLTFLIALQMSSIVYAQTCEVAEQYNRHGNVRIASGADLSSLETRLKNEPAIKKTIDDMLGIGAAAAILQNRYAAYLIEIGCSENIVNSNVDPLTNVVILNAARVPRSKLVNLCKKWFPATKSGRDELWVKASDYFLRYRGKECAAFKF